MVIMTETTTIMMKTRWAKYICRDCKDVTRFLFSKDVTYSEAGYEDYYDYEDEAGGEYTEGAGYEEYYEEESDNSVQEDPAPDTADTGETTATPEESEEPDSYKEKEEESRMEQIVPAEPSTTVTSYYVSRLEDNLFRLLTNDHLIMILKEEEQSRDYENYDGEEDYQPPDETSEDADTAENRDRDSYDEDPNYTEEEDKYEEPYEESNAEEQEAER